ncbi:hypothetical protein Q4Q35_16440 [Flavivirga aquimarina]|uniref:DUF3822 domain-containing protein n=1 Tax=Flavivirga aquimarina TaxID=2027862 RepID=A0ABT8WEG0_9FLAO|nr:hypothetical protein [Flavivirga aquimarina]MDO5971396.1 hypothetical protein [Flavivirga aquimarina]
MEIKPLEQGQSRNEIICDSYLISQFSKIEEIIEIYLRLSEENKGHSVLITLDDLSQAEYTCAHSTMNNNLDETDGYDLSTVDSFAFENGEHLGYLSTPSEFFIRKKNFDKGVIGVEFDSIFQKDISVDEDELGRLIDVNQNPNNWIDEYIIAKIVPVEKPYEAICAFPNGYFSCDLNPFENYVLAKRLYENYKYKLFGIGASLIGFIRDEKLQENEYKKLLKDLSKIYSQTESNIEKFVNRNKKYNLLFLKYTEQLE